MQKFTNIEFEKFKKYFCIKNNIPSANDEILINKAIKYIKFIKYIPGIKFIGIGNSVSMFISTKNSDIDLFIITSKNRLWIVRILLTLFLSILGQKKTKNKHNGKFCLSFFCDENGMNFANFAIENDIYLYFWIIYLKPILSFENTYDKFINSQTWANFGDYKEIIKNNKKFIKYLGKSFGDNCKILDLIDKILKKIFISKTLKNFEKLGKPYGIIINDNMLKFHNNDKRIEIKKDLI